jgi:tripartite-type tricarboxylate transporter receptor subunit TctC
MTSPLRAPRRRSALQAAAVLLLALAVPATSFAQAWPQKPIRIVVPFSAGGNTDSIARITAEWLTQKLGQTVIVENKPGASGAIAAEFVARAPADGYTLFMATLPQMAVLPAMTKTPYDPVADFAPVSIVASNAFALVVNEAVPAKTLQELVAYVRKNPTKLIYASAGNASLSHLSVVLFLKRAGIDMEHVSYKGGAPALADVVAGHAPMYFGNLAEIIPQSKSGKIRVLAVSGDKRAPQLPNVPTVAEQGYPGYRTNTWNAIAAPAKTPSAITERLAREIGAAARDPGFIQRLENIGVDPVGNTPAEFAAVLKSDLAIWAEAVKVSGVKAD